jgi:hypothetical protein
VLVPWSQTLPLPYPWVNKFLSIINYPVCGVLLQ